MYRIISALNGFIREEMISNPPHIFITNYAMLEYLMVRPEENTFFEGAYAKNWRFIVFDEAHVYSGSTGIEVSMLFRRLQAKLDAKKLTYILTSATLGEKEDDENVAIFAQNLCNAHFDSSDVVRADRIVLSPEGTTRTIDIGIYEAISKCIDEGDFDDIRNIVSCDENLSVEENLYNIVICDQNYWEIRGLLKSPNSVAYIAEILGWTQQQVACFVNVASMCEKNNVKLFDARYHMFLRATESAFVTLAPDNRIMLERQNVRYNYETGKTYKVLDTVQYILLLPFLLLIPYCDKIFKGYF